MSPKKPPRGPRKRIRTKRKKRPWVPIEVDEQIEEVGPVMSDNEVAVGPGKEAASRGNING